MDKKDFNLNISRFRAFVLSCLRTLLICFTGIMLLPAGCVLPFEPAGVKDTAGILVVEGMIMETGTTIKLSRTVTIFDTSDKPASGLEGVSNARVHVIDDNNRVIAVALPQNAAGTEKYISYVVHDSIPFNPGVKYALDIHTGDRHYQSAFVTPAGTPEIDEITWQQNTDNSIDIMVSTHDTENATKYYRWEFEEDWEIRSRYLALLRYDPETKTVVEQSIRGPNNRYYCWTSDKSKSLILGTSDRLTETRIKNKKIYRFPAGTSRFSYLYSILVKQYGIDQEAYTYFENIQKNIEQSGSIFSPQPTELQGNIRCVSHPGEPVIGYICATKKVVSRIFIDMEFMKGDDEFDCAYADPPWGRSWVESELPYAYENNALGIVYRQPGGFTFELAHVRCVDCTERGGTKNKPDFWPNNHQ